MNLRFIPVPSAAVCVRALAALLCGFRATGQSADSGLLGWWRFDRAGVPFVEDASGHGYDGVLHNVGWARGPFGTAGYFSGRRAYVTIPGPEELDGSDELSITAWVLWESTGRYPNVVTGGRWSPGGFLVFVADDLCSFRLGRPGFRAGDGTGQWKEIGVPLLKPIPLRQWVHIAAVFKRPEIRTYVNGRQAGRARWPYPLGFKGDIRLGCWTPAGACHHGLLDEVKLFARALPPEEVAAEFAVSRAERRTSDYEIVRLKPDAFPRSAVFESKVARMEIGRAGQILRLVDKVNHRDLLAAPGLLGVVRTGKRVHVPLEVRRTGDLLHIRCSGNAAVTLRVTLVPGPAFRFEVTDVQPPDARQVDILHLPLFEGPDRGRMAGLVGDDRSAVCVRAVNLQANVQLNGQTPALIASAGRTYGLRGSAAAVVAGPRTQIQGMLQKLTLALALDVPVSRLGGAFSLGNEALRGSYLFARISEDNVDDWIALAQRGGFADLHYSGWWQSLGHYEPSKRLFPNGLEGMKRTAERIRSAGIASGMHTLTGCISLHDAWVRPEPDPRLDADASYTLAADLDAASDRVPVEEKPNRHDVIPGYASRGNYLRIGRELVQYRAISYEPPYAFLNCRRGALATKPSPHRRGERVDHLRHLYNAFYPREDSTLVGELADRIARVYNACGMSELYQDGAEGMGTWHSVAVMRRAIFERLNKPVLIEASCHGHHNWWFHSRLGAWDHPKWAPKRFTDRHAAHCERLRRTDLLEPQMGWWALIGPSHISRGMFPDEVEYFMTKCMSIDAAMSIQGVAVGATPPNARQGEYFTLIGWYERLRLARYFDDETIRRLRPQGFEVRLRQAASGVWNLLPAVYRKHKVCGLRTADARWTENNPFDAQPVRLRLEALYGLRPYDAPDTVPLPESATPSAYTIRRTASGVHLRLEPGDPDPAHGGPTLVLNARHDTDDSRGAWGHAGIRFQPYRDITPGQAVALWVHGDGQGEVLNIQLTNPREYMGAIAEHYVVIDFNGWRYVEIPFRERSAAQYDEYRWPYYSQHGIFRNALNPHVVNGLNLYLNNIPAHGAARVRISAVHFPRLRRLRLEDVVITVNGSPLRLPFALESGQYLELEVGRLVHYDERGAPLATAALRTVPALRKGANRIAFSCAPVAAGNARAEMTFIALGPPFGRRRPSTEIDWKRLDREYALPRTVFRLDGRDNVWDLRVHPDRPSPRIEAEIFAEFAPLSPDAYTGADAVLLDDASDPNLFAESATNRYTRYVYGNGVRNVPALPGVTFRIESAPGRSGKALRFTARSTREDARGWCAVGRRFEPPLDLKGCSRIGFFLQGDGKGELFKVQLRDVRGKWLDLVTRVDFDGRRFCEFRLDSRRLDLSRIEYLLVFYNGLPGNDVPVSCTVDDIVALRTDPVLRRPSLRIGDRRVTFPVDLREGERLQWSGGDAAAVRDASGAVRTHVPPTGVPWKVHPGVNPVEFSASAPIPRGLRIRIDLTKVYIVPGSTGPAAGR